MGKYTRNEKIAILVIEDQIWNYYNSIIDRLMNVNDGKWFSDIDTDDIKGIKSRANKIFKHITNFDIYEALGQAYDYDKATIIGKLYKHKRKIDCWVKYFTTDEIDSKGALTDICYLFQVTESHNTKAYKKAINGVSEGIIDADILTEEDIYEIKDIVNKRSDAIYDGNPDSVVTPAIVEFERKMIEYEKEKTEVDIPVNEEPMKKQVCQIDKIEDGNTIKKALRDVVGTYTSMGCTNITFEVNLEDGTSWCINFRKLWKNK